MKIIAFSGSNSSTSINQTLLQIIQDNFKEYPIDLLDLRQLDLPIFSVDIERNEGYPEALKELIDQLKQADALLLALPEHNGFPTAFFKNLIDWMSRMDKQFLGNNPTVLLSTSPGSKGGANALERVAPSFKYWGAEVVGQYSVPFFKEAYDKENNTLTAEHMNQIGSLLQQLVPAKPV